MKNLTDLQNRLRAEIEIWFPKQCADPSQFYLYYVETTPEHDGGFGIYRDKPANPDCKVAAKLEAGSTKDQNFNRLQAILRTLPILSYEN